MRSCIPHPAELLVCALEMRGVNVHQNQGALCARSPAVNIYVSNHRGLLLRIPPAASIPNGEARKGPSCFAVCVIMVGNVAINKKSAAWLQVLLEREEDMEDRDIALCDDDLVSRELLI